MSWLSLRSLFRPGVLLMMVSTVGVAHAASLDISSDSLDAWVMHADIQDTSPPTITAAISPPPNGAGWNNTATTVTFTCSDTWSGVATCTAPVTNSTDGTDQIVSGTATDMNGNAASTSVTLDIDVTPPTLDIVGVSDGDTVTTMPTVTCTASDALSGLDAPCTVTVTQQSGTQQSGTQQSGTQQSGGAFLAEASAVDVAGNVTTRTARFWNLVVCGTGPTDTPCVVPEGTVITRRITWNADVLVLGSVNERIEVTGGTVTIGSTGYVKKDVTQTGDGDIVVAAGAEVDGKIDESGNGSVLIDGAVRKHVTENGPGDLVVGPGAVVDLWTEEFGPGSLLLDGAVGKDATEADDGDMVIGDGASVGLDAGSSGAGTCTVSPLAAIGGQRQGSCAV